MRTGARISGEFRLTRPSERIHNLPSSSSASMYTSGFSELNQVKLVKLAERSIVTLEEGASADLEYVCVSGRRGALSSLRESRGFVIELKLETERDELNSE